MNVAKLQHMRVRSPGLDRRTTFPLAHGVGAGVGGGANGHGNHVDDRSGAQRSDGSEADGDMDMAGDTDADMGGMSMPLSMPVPMHLGGVPALNGIAPPHEAERQQHNYSFAASGSGGFGFGPGAEEDEDEDEMGKEYNSELEHPAEIMGMTRRGGQQLTRSGLPNRTLSLLHAAHQPQPLFQPIPVPAHHPPPEIAAFGTTILDLAPRAGERRGGRRGRDRSRFRLRD
jgi:hypothetical protein